ncbi:MAG: hypothetical protein U9O56_07980 [Campylobacterota bacterium]|nr:hypothetical protein [Campylobacterota bacterium]
MIALVLKPTISSSDDMMKSLNDLPKQTTTFSSNVDNVVSQSTPPQQSTISPIEINVVDFDSMDENEILMSGLENAKTDNSTKNSIEEFIKSNNIDESTMFDDSDLLG